MINNKLKQRKGLIIGLLGVLCITPDSMLLKLADTDFFDLIFLRGLFLVPSLLIVYLIQRRKQRDLVTCFQRTWKASFVVGMFVAISAICFILSISLTKAANTLIIISMSPLITAFFVWLFTKEKPTLPFIFATFLCCIGSTIMFSGSIKIDDFYGIIAAFGAIIFLSFQFIWLNNKKNADPTLGLLLGTIFTLIFASFFTQNLTVDWITLLIIAIDATLVNGLSFLLIFRALKETKATYMSLLFLIETVLGPIWVFLVLKEIPSSETLLGGVFILVAITGFLFYQIKKLR